MESTGVLICGCGRTGAMLASQLGRLGIRHVCLDKDQGINTDPRGISLDEDGIRALQSCGIYETIYN
jgi:2-polyprenyl-6-methoxyphenol hydroxylase-like FAD-dependent oxidoreductase